ncbi:MAG: polysaccharide deacetylase family protein [Streptosporangiaceae bacterium]
MTGYGDPARDWAGYGGSPPKGSWPGGARVAVNVAVNIEEGAERSFFDGDDCNEGLVEMPRTAGPGVRDLAVESMYEYGSRAGVFRLLRLFDRLEIPVTAFAAARALERSPDVAEVLAGSAHEVCAHGLRWAEAWRMSRTEEQASIRQAVQAIAVAVGRRPVGWYSRWMPSVHTRQLLVEEGGFLYDADAYNDDIPYYAAVDGRWHLVVPYSLSCNDGAFSYGHLASPSDFVDYGTRALAYLVSEQDGTPRMLSIGIHPRISGQPARASAVAELLDRAVSMDAVWIATRQDIAEYWLAEHPPPREAPPAGHTALADDIAGS